MNTNADRSEEADSFASIIAELAPDERLELLRIWKDHKADKEETSQISDLYSNADASE